MAEISESPQPHLTATPEVTDAEKRPSSDYASFNTLFNYSMADRGAPISAGAASALASAPPDAPASRRQQVVGNNYPVRLSSGYSSGFYSTTSSKNSSGFFLKTSSKNSSRTAAINSALMANKVNPQINLNWKSGASLGAFRTNSTKQQPRRSRAVPQAAGIQSLLLGYVEQPAFLSEVSPAPILSLSFLSAEGLDVAIDLPDNPVLSPGGPLAIFQQLPHDGTLVIVKNNPQDKSVTKPGRVKSKPPTADAIKIIPDSLSPGLDTPTIINSDMLIAPGHAVPGGIYNIPDGPGPNDPLLDVTPQDINEPVSDVLLQGIGASGLSGGLALNFITASYDIDGYEEPVVLMATSVLHAGQYQSLSLIPDPAGILPLSVGALLMLARRRRRS